MKLLKKVTLMVLCLTLAACAQKKLIEKSSSESPQDLQKPEPTKSKTIPSSFKLSGAIAVNNNGKGWNASLNWNQQGPNYYTIHLSGPLGGKTVIINKKGTNLTYQEGSKIIKANSDTELLKRKTNINLPVNNLYYWVRGIPAPSAVTYSKKDSNNNNEIIQQQGFTITYSQYTTAYKNIMLPKKIKISGEDIMIKIVIKNWS